MHFTPVKVLLNIFAILSRILLAHCDLAIIMKDSLLCYKNVMPFDSVINIYKVGITTLGM